MYTKEKKNKILEERSNFAGKKFTTHTKRQEHISSESRFRVYPRNIRNVFQKVYLFEFWIFFVML